MALIVGNKAKDYVIDKTKGETLPTDLKSPEHDGATLLEYLGPESFNAYMWIGGNWKKLASA